MTILNVNFINSITQNLEYAHENDACIDLAASETTALYPNTPTLIPTGMKVAVPNQHVMLIFPRSGLSLKGVSMANGVGVVDPSYRGEIKVPLVYFRLEQYFEVTKGMRIAQFLIMPAPRIICNVVSKLPNTERGDNGLGSTGE